MYTRIFVNQLMQNQNLIQTSLITMVTIWYKIPAKLITQKPGYQETLCIVGKTMAQINSVAKLPVTPAHMTFLAVNVMKQGLNKSRMKESTSSGEILCFCLKDTDLGLSKPYYVSPSHRAQWLLCQTLPRLSLHFCMVYRGSCGRAQGWADTLINTPNRHLLCGVKGREKTSK